MQKLIQLRKISRLKNIGAVTLELRGSKFGNPLQRCELALRLKTIIQAKAKERQVRKPNFVPQNSAKQNAMETRNELSKLAGVS